MNSSQLQLISIAGYKSIKQLDDFELRSLNVLIGANGAGKSNFVDCLRMLRAMADGRLANFVREGGGADTFLFGGAKVTEEIRIHFRAHEADWVYSFAPSLGGDLHVTTYRSLMTAEPSWTDPLGWVIYHFHDTSNTAGMRREHSVRDFRELRSDASNLAAFLYWMKAAAPLHYLRIRQTVQIIAPFFDDFLLEPESKGPNEVIRLEWRQKATDYPFQPWQLSDGTIRFICLATALLQPELPLLIVIDEPELGLHPFALDLLVSLVKETAQRTQIVISTQSPAFLSGFDPEDVVVVQRSGGASKFLRLDETSLRDWLDDYTLGELVQKNVIEAGPAEAPSVGHR